MSYDTSKRLVVSYGAGANSNAALELLRQRGIVPDLILNADTKGERHSTYTNITKVNDWCLSVGFPTVTIVSADGPSLEEDCLTRGSLPSIAFGFKSCSDRYKIRPQLKYFREWANDGEAVNWAIGFDAGEPHRARESGDSRRLNWFPLIEWNIDREECVEICKRAGLPYSKSSCFYCPSMKRHEIFALKREHPDLLERALAMERKAEPNLTGIKGLGRNFAWNDLIRNEENQGKLFSDSCTPEIPCGCYD